MKLEKTFSIQAGPEKVLEIIRNPKFIEEDEKDRHAQSVAVKDLKKTADQHVYEVKSVAFARGMTGIDKTKTQTNTNTTTWDLKKMVGTWSYLDGSDFASKIHIKGGFKIAKKGDGSDLTMWVDINIDIPFLGGSIAKKLGAGFERGWPGFIDRVGKWAKK